MPEPGTLTIALVGFGEAASAFVAGWGRRDDRIIKAYDIKTDSHDPSVREGKWEDFRNAGVKGCATLEEALSGAQQVFSLVTADQALVAAQNASQVIEAGALYLDCNSCSPGTKRRAATLIEKRGGRYVDVAVMAPVHPALHRTPLLLSGPASESALRFLKRLEMNANVAEGGVGASSSVKMIRSIMIKGLEALVAECLLAGQRAGASEAVLDTLEASFPGFGWRERAAYMLERMATHGVRRAAEMREVAATVEELGLSPDMSRACTRWQQRIGELNLRAEHHDYRALADEILKRLPAGGSRKNETMSENADYHDIPGTYVFDAEQSRRGYHLNMFCMSLRQAENREAFKADEAAYLERFPMTPEQRDAVLRRDWNEMLRLGGNIYYTSKLAATDGITFQDLAAIMTGVTREEYRQMMVNGGRPIEGNRYKSEWKSRG
ncbi:MAG: hypothetical protein Kow006_10340 [Gammaproteobacteria bacterium]